MKSLKIVVERLPGFDEGSLKIVEQPPPRFDAASLKVVVERLAGFDEGSLTVVEQPPPPPPRPPSFDVNSLNITTN